MSRRFQVSLVLNIVLAVSVVALVMHKSQPAPISSAREVAPEKISNDVLVTSQPRSPRYSEIVSVAGRRLWLVDQLRAAGVPNDVLSRVVLSDIEEQWQKRFEDSAENGHGDGDSMAKLQLEHDQSEDAEMRAALGEEGYRQWDQGNMLREANMGKLELSESESNSIYDLKKKLQQRQWDLAQGKLNGEIDDSSFNDAIDNAYSDFNQQMKALLGDERYAKSQGTDAGTAATNLLHDLAKAKPTDSQFQDLLKAQDEMNKRRSELDKQFQDNPTSTAYAEQIKALDAARDEEYQRVLGTNVFDNLQKEQDIGYSRMKKCENIWGLDDNKIDYVYSSIKYYEKSVEDYQAQARALEAKGQSVDWDGVNKNLQQFAKQTQQALQNYLGQDSFSKMQRNGIFQFGQ
jgi:hypothetical protein